jgi:hypothetical protein
MYQRSVERLSCEPSGELRRSALQVQAAHGVDKLEFIFPSDNEKAVSQAMDQMLLSRDSAK